MSSPTTTPPATSSAANGTISLGSNLKVVGIILAIVSGLLIGSSFVFKKKGLLRSQAGQVAGEGVAYLKSPLWWCGMIMMIMGEICNFAAYAFVEAIVVTPLGALSVVICAILSSIFLKETLTFFGWLGCALCIFGSTIIALNGPQESTIGQITEFQKLFLAPGFLAYSGVLILASLIIIFYFAPRYGKKSMLWYIFVCSMIGGISVSVTTGVGAAIVTTAQGDNQFKHWFLYFLIGFVAVTLITEVYYLNCALALFNTAMVTPTYYVIFTFFSMVTTVVLFQGLKSTVSQILTIVMAFLVICVGITVLQMSKVDPVVLGNKLDRRSTILLQAAREKTESTALAEEKGALVGLEDPGIDTLRGSFGTVGSIIRARSARRMSMRSADGANTSARSRGIHGTTRDANAPWLDGIPQTATPRASTTLDRLNGVQRHQLYDRPVPLPSRNDSTTALTASDAGATQGDDNESIASSKLISKKPTIKFGAEDVVHQYHPPGQGKKGERDDKSAIHEHRLALGNPGVTMPSGYPPPPRLQTTSSPSLPPPPPPPPSSSTTDLLGLSPTPPEVRQQSISMPSAFRYEHEVHSAPPTVSPRFNTNSSSGPRIHAKDVFTSSPISDNNNRNTLKSFPSVTDSGRSSDEDGEGGDEGRSRGRTAKRYPKGARDLDREESVSLWQQRDGDEHSQSPPRGDGESGGIRLVTRK